MRAIAIGIMMLAGAIMASAGANAEAMPAAKRWSTIDEWGLGVVALGAVFMVVEFFKWRPFPVSNGALRTQDFD